MKWYGIGSLIVLIVSAELCGAVGIALEPQLGRRGHGTGGPGEAATV